MLKHLQQLALDHADFVDDRIGASERLPTPVSFSDEGSVATFPTAATAERRVARVSPHRGLSLQTLSQG